MDRNAKLAEVVEDLLAGSEFEVVDVRTSGSPRGVLVRIFVDKEGGVTLEDCARLSRAVGDRFEEVEALSGKYVLEVSSPGVDRPLRRPEDFARFAGETAQVSTYEKIAGRNRHTGVLDGFDADEKLVRMTTEAGETLAIPLGGIKKANLRRDPWSGGKNRKKKK